MKSDEQLNINVLDLEYQITFKDDAEKIEIGSKVVAEKTIRITLGKFDNVLGTTLMDMNVGTLGGRLLVLNMFVEAVEKNKAVSYTLYLGGAVA